MRTVHLIAAARPNFMKIAPLWHALTASPSFACRIVHTGQHYDPNLSDAIFADLSLPAPDHHLGVGSGSHAVQTGGVMIGYETIALADRPDWLVVVGDVNSTLACALVGAKLRIPTIHLEAGLRSGDRDMPEEINRIATDSVADILWTPSPDGDANLRAEGVAPERITRVGNIMLDSFEMVRADVTAAAEWEAHRLNRATYGVVTLHRPSNVDGEERLRALGEALIALQRRVPLIFPVHPRTAAKLAEAGIDDDLIAAGVRLIEPLPYKRFMSLVLGSRLVVTDSGGIQEETTYLGIPCLTLRDTTERPITIVEGTNQLATLDTLVMLAEEALGTSYRPRRPALWDGRTAARCVADLLARSS